MNTFHTKRWVINELYAALFVHTLLQSCHKQSLPLIVLEVVILTRNMERKATYPFKVTVSITRVLSSPILHLTTYGYIDLSQDKI